MMRAKENVPLMLLVMFFVVLSCATWGLERPLVCPHKAINICQLDQARCGAIAVLQTADKKLSEFELAKAFDKAMRICLKSAKWK